MRQLVSFLAVLAFGCSSSSDPAPATDAAAEGGSDFPLDATSETSDPSSCPGPLAYDPASLDCVKSCASYNAWCDASACSNPYCKTSDCEAACNAVKGSTRFSNVVFGCAAEHSDCAEYTACRASKCP